MEKDQEEKEEMDVEEEEEVVEEEDSTDDSDLEKEQEEQFVLERRVVELRKEVVIQFFLFILYSDSLVFNSQLSRSPNAYNLHVELINSLRKLGELDQLRHARESMHAIYPLSEGMYTSSSVLHLCLHVILHQLDFITELWLDWLRDETKMGTTEEDKEKMELLFKRATQDYLSKEN